MSGRTAWIVNKLGMNLVRSVWQPYLYTYLNLHWIHPDMWYPDACVSAQETIQVILNTPGGYLVFIKQLEFLLY